ncbi:MULTISPECIES: hypothetical protein [unclassified Halanaerobium]|uniref:hypothetical protein n=1 Tax=unclassified Halanaerobium TaxID=2641197 RepID=UPI000DF2FCF6|nr:MULTISPECIES: hypothetical protein [unclassified Halanaerobium]RCW41997.1 hypothetical protein DFR78_12716 [Halanaerobium sp. MA284_MarDTE_T2]RCW79958.1 hypothetical protein DER71_13316 [Halanaerobium sp. DL-01]
MTHTLHREGSVESLQDDLLLLITPAITYNDKGAAEKIKKMIDIVFDVGPTNYGCYELGMNILSGVEVDVIKEETKDNSRIRCVFSDKEKFKDVLRRIIEADLGLSVTVSGLQSIVKEVLDEMEIDPHSVNLAMGTHGATEKLPDENFRKITTMCGHAMVAPGLVEDMIVKVKKGQLTIDEAAVEIAKPCICGVFNHERAALLLKEIMPLYVITD